MPAVIKECTALLVTLVILTGCAGQTAEFAIEKLP